MEISDFTEKEIEEVVNSFKSYIKLVVEHSSIDFARKIKSKKYMLISLNEVSVEKEASLLLSNNDASISLEDKVDEKNAINLFENTKYAKFFEKLTNNEKKVLNLFSRNYSIKQIARILNISETNVTTIKYRAMQKLKEMMREK